MEIKRSHKMTISYIVILHIITIAIMLSVIYFITTPIGNIGNVDGNLSNT